MARGTTTPGGPVSGRLGPDIDRDRARGDEPVDKVLRQLDVDLADAPGSPLGLALQRVVDVDVEAVLVRGVPDPAADLRPEVAAAAHWRSPRPHTDPRRPRVLAREATEHSKGRAHQFIGAPAPGSAVGALVADRFQVKNALPSLGKRTPRTSEPDPGTPTATESWYATRGRSGRSGSTGAAGGPRAVMSAMIKAATLQIRERSAQES